MSYTKKTVLVLGAGIGGMRVVRRLQKSLPTDYEIILLDKNYLHIFTPDLYQVATVFSKKISASCLARLKDSIATPIRTLIDTRRVIFIRDEVLSINTKIKSVVLKNNEALSYDILVVALGSVSNFFNVAGAKKYAFSFKTLEDALAVNSNLEKLFLDRYEQIVHEPINICIAGGGATGVEVAGELMGTLNKLCEKYHYDRSKVTVRLMQSGSSLAGFNETVSLSIQEELERIGVELYLGHRVSRVLRNKVKLLRQSDDILLTLGCNMLIWTCGVKVNPVVADSLGDKKHGGAILLNQSLQAIKQENIFALGDCALLRVASDKDSYVPMMAQYAMKEGDIVAENILRLINGRKLKKFKMGKLLYVLPVGFHFALFRCGERIFNNIFTPFLKPIITFKYALSILPPRKAWEKFRLGKEIWMQNDD